MKIMSFNTQHCMNYVTRKIDFEIMAKTILDCGADVVGLNEMRDAGQDPEYTAQVETACRADGNEILLLCKGDRIFKQRTLR